MKAYKSIFRLDFPVSFIALDRFGSYCHFLHEQTNQAPFFETHSDVNLPTNSMSSAGKVRSSDKYRFTITLSAIDGIVEYKPGLELSSLSRHPIFALGDSVLHRVEESLGNDYTRVGLRSWVIIEGASLSFVRVRDHIRKLLAPLDSAVGGAFPRPHDVALVFEAKDEGGTNVRVHCGPYQNSEYSKYFGSDPGVADAFILDIDFFEAKVQIPRFRLTKFAARHQEAVRSIGENLARYLREVTE